MKALIINCSPVKTGATAEIASIIEMEISTRYDTKCICIDDYDFKFCKGCRSCHSTAKCVMDDDIMCAGARILNIASASSFQPNPYLSMYSASKVFLKNLSRALSVELKPRGITVTAVCPGWVDTGMFPREKNGRPIRYIGMVKPDVVVKKALRDSRYGKDLSTPGFFAGYFRFLL